MVNSAKRESMSTEKIVLWSMLPFDGLSEIVDYNDLTAFMGACSNLQLLVLQKKNINVCLFLHHIYF